MSRHGALAALAVILCAAAGFRLYQVTERSFWFDEAFSWMLADRFSWFDMLDRTGRDVHPPGFYAVLHLWSALFGESVAALRACAVFFGLATVGLTYLLCVEAFTEPPQDGGPDSVVGPRSNARGVGIFSAVLVAFGSVHIAWSRETRMYTLGTALALLTTWLLLRALRPGGSAAGKWAGYAVAAAALLYTHNYGLFTVVGQFMFIGLQTLRQFRTRSCGLLPSLYGVLAACAAVWLYAPWAPILLQQKKRVQTEYWINQISWWSIPECWYELFFPTNAGQPPDHAPTLVLTVVLIAALAWFALARRTSGRTLITLLVVAPVVCSAVISATTVSITTTRHFLFSQLFMLIVIGDVAWRSFAGQARHVVLALLVADSTYAHACYWDELDVRHKPGVRGAVEHVLQRRTGKDLIVVLHPCVFYSVKYYCRDVADPKLLLDGRFPKHFYGGPLITKDTAIGELDLESLDADRIWVVGTSGFSGYTEPALPDNWVPVNGMGAVHPDVYSFQGQVYANQYERKRGDDT